MFRRMENNQGNISGGGLKLILVSIFDKSQFLKTFNSIVLKKNKIKMRYVPIATY